MNTRNLADRRIHWLGAGLSSRPGFEALVRRGWGSIFLWNRTISRAEAWVREIAHPTVEARTFTFDVFREALAPGDIVISMFPADVHVEVARICLERRAHLVTTSYLSAEMKALDARAREIGVAFANEAGLDPGIDHLFAHALVAGMRSNPRRHEIATVDFHSLCGGFPARVTDDFRYRFSWSPLGVLRALLGSARWIADGEVREAERPFEWTAPWSFKGECLEMYPNRNSVNYVAEYGLEEFRPTLRTFMRGTFRPAGWRTAWAPIFARLRGAEPTALTALANSLAERYSYRDGERDRVCMEVRLTARDQTGAPIFDEGWRIDETGDGRNASAMAKLVSYPAIIAAESIARGEMPPGVQGIPKEPRQIASWITDLREVGCGLEHFVYSAPRLSPLETALPHTAVAGSILKIDPS